MYCPECGAEIKGSNFCSECGTKIIVTNVKAKVIETKIKTNDFNAIIKSKRKQKDNHSQLLKEAEAEGNYNITGKGNENLIYMADDGIKTGNGLFIPYKKITLIEGKTNISRENAFAFGLIGLAAGLTLQTVEITFAGGKIIMRDVNKNNANIFINAVREKVINA